MGWAWISPEELDLHKRNDGSNTCQTIKTGLRVDKSSVFSEPYIDVYHKIWKFIFDLWILDNKKEERRTNKKNEHYLLQTTKSRGSMDNANERDHYTHTLYIGDKGVSSPVRWLRRSWWLEK